MAIISAWKNLTRSKLKKSEAKFKRKNRKQGQLLSESGTLDSSYSSITPPSLSCGHHHHQGRSSCSKTLSIFSARYFPINVLCPELIICCYNIDIKDLLSPKAILGYEPIAKIKVIAVTKNDESNNIN